jgi:hypothetical protein
MTGLSILAVGLVSLEINWLDHEIDHSSPSRAKVKNAWSSTTSSLNAFRAWCLVKHVDNFTFLHKYQFSSLHIGVSVEVVLNSDAFLIKSSLCWALAMP